VFAGRRGLAGLAALIAVGLVGAGIAYARIQPLVQGMVGYDMAASVLYFDRIVAGARLEGFVEATPKALLTVVDGLAMAATRDWRSISVLAVLGYGLNIALATWLAARLGGLPAAGFAFVGMLSSSALLDDAAYAYAVGPALTGWLVAGLALTASRPRYLLAGIALALAGLARYETVLLDGAAVAMLAGAVVVARLRGTTPPTRGAWWLAVGFASVLVEALHDWLLTGDPFWAIEVSAIVSSFRRVLTLGNVVTLIWTHYRSGVLVIALAVVGALVLARGRRWAILAGIAVLVPGILAFQLALAFKGTYVSNRYLYPADLGLVFAAAIGAGGAWSAAARRVLSGSGRERVGVPEVIGAVVAAGLGFVAVTMFTPLKPVTARIATNQAIYANAEAASQSLRATLATESPGRLARPANPDPRNRDRTNAALVVPVLLVPRLAVDLGLPVTQLADSALPLVSPDGPVPRAGQLVVHESHLDRPVSAYAFLEVSANARIGSITLDPLFVDAAAGIWVERVGGP